MKRKSTDSISSTLTGVVIFLVVVMVVGFLFVFTNNFTSPLRNFYVSYGNDDIITDRDNFEIELGKEYKFKVHTHFKLEDKQSRYIVTVTPNPNTDFTFKANETDIQFSSLETLSKGFEIDTFSDYFNFTAHFDLPQILQMYYPSQTLEDVPTAVDSEIPYFILSIYNHDKSECININFSLLSSTNTINEDYSLVLSPVNDTRDVDTDELIENAVTFSANQIVLSKDCASIIFEFYLKDGYAFEEVVCLFDCYTLEIDEENGTCVVSLTEELTSNLDYVLKFRAYPVLYSLTITPVETSGSGLLTFSQDKILLDEARTSATFNYYLSLDYMYDIVSCEYPIDFISVLIDKDNRTCTITLDEYLTEDLSIELKFNLVKVNYLSINFVDASHNEDSTIPENVITFTSFSIFPPDCVVLSELQPSMTFGYSVAEGYEFSHYAISCSCCSIIVNEKNNTFTITLIEDLTSHKSGAVYFYAVEECNTLTLSPVNDTRDVDTDELIENAVTFSVSEIVLSADCTSATFEFYFAEGYALDYVDCLFDCYTLEIDEENGTCTVSLTEELTEDLDYVLKFKAYKL